jgi:outer membrane protein assembly factor BamB
MNRKKSDISKSEITNSGITRLSRRAALLGPPALLSGCSLYDDWFGKVKPPLPGQREAIGAVNQALAVESGSAVKVVLPEAVRNAAWPTPGGNPAHLAGHLAAADRLAEVWRASIGTGGGYRRKILAQPVIEGGIVFAMDSGAVITAFDANTGARKWRLATRDEDDDSTNIGGGMSVDQGVLYAVNGLADALAIDAATGSVRWRRNTGTPARSAPTIAEGRMFYVTFDDRLLALDINDGRQIWSYHASSATTSLLGQPAPAYADGLVVAGFGSGELATLRADSGGVAWTDSLAAAGQSAASEVSAIRGLPVIANGRVYAIGLGGLCLSIDLRSGRRLWEREIGGSDNPWIAGDWMFVVTTGQRITALNRADGRPAWAADLPKFDNEEKKRDPIHWFGPVLVGDRLVVAGNNSQALAISPYTGETLGQQDLSGPASLAPAVADGTLYVVTDNGSLTALR